MKCRRAASNAQREGTPVSDAPLIEVRDLCVAYGNVEAVRDVSLTAARGSIVTVIGPNGAGKTTLLAALMGVLPSRGAISYRGDAIGRLSIEQRVARGIVLVPEKRELFASMSVDDHLLLGAFTRRRDGDVAQLRNDVYRRFPRLGERRSQLAATLSGGERQMLALGRGLMARPQLLLLDEPSLGLAPRVVRDIFAIIAGLRETGVTILLVEQNARAALAVADYGYVLETGAVALAGDSRTLAADPRVAATYLGSMARAAAALERVK
jgi:branched-chain amino acid transport system ATP-binding protein